LNLLTLLLEENSGLHKMSTWRLLKRRWLACDETYIDDAEYIM